MRDRYHCHLDKIRGWAAKIPGAFTFALIDIEKWAVERPC